MTASAFLRSSMDTKDVECSREGSSVLLAAFLFGAPSMEPSLYVLLTAVQSVIEAMELSLNGTGVPQTCLLRCVVTDSAVTALSTAPKDDKPPTLMAIRYSVASETPKRRKLSAI